jgi:hypothetical protein
MQSQVFFQYQSKKITFGDYPEQKFLIKLLQSHEINQLV